MAIESGEWREEARGACSWGAEITTKPVTCRYARGRVVEMSEESVEVEANVDPRLSVEAERWSEINNARRIPCI